MKNIRNLTMFLFIAIGFTASVSDFIKSGELYYSPNKIIVKLNSEIAPKLGIEPSLDLVSRSALLDELTSYGVVESFTPVFKFYSNFNSKHWEFELHQFYVITYSGTVNIDQILENLINHPDIIDVNPNYRAEAFTVPNDPYYSLQWAHDNTGQAISYSGGNVGTPDCDTDTDYAWDITQGSDDIVISIIDTGVNGNHEEFAGKMVPGYDFVNNDSDASDDHMHGTACAGIAAAQGNNGTGIAGVAWNCKIMPIKVLDSGGYGDFINIANGIQWSADNGANVISMSLGGGGFDNTMNSAINYANSLGVAILSAAGNDNSSNISYPAAYDGSMAVGSLSPCNERKEFSSCDGENFWGSNYGDGLDFLSPGVRIHTTALNGGYMSDFNGTSSATPHAAGIAGLLLSAMPTLTPENVREIMQVSSDDLSSPGWDTQTGWGRLNAYMALAYLTGGPEIGLDQEELLISIESGDEISTDLSIINGGEIDLNVNIDPFGYSYTNSDDEGEYSWIDISGEGIIYSFPHNDQAGTTLDIGFDFPFYGESYSECIINANGWVGFGTDNSGWDNLVIPSSEAPTPAIFGFWDDLNPVNDGCNEYCSGNVYYHGNEDRFVVWFDEVAHWYTNYEDNFYSFQIVLYPDGNIDLNYQSITDISSATIGFQDAGADNGILIAYNNTFAHSELSVPINMRAPWLGVSPTVLSVPPGGISTLTVTVDASNLEGGLYSEELVIHSNDFDNPQVVLPITVDVGGGECFGWQLGDLNNDGTHNVLDIVRVINIILEAVIPEDCEIWAADMNEDLTVNIQDIVLIVNLIIN